jgi:hypothetical protein
MNILTLDFIGKNANRTPCGDNNIQLKECSSVLGLNRLFSLGVAYRKLEFATPHPLLFGIVPHNNVTQ